MSPRDDQVGVTRVDTIGQAGKPDSPLLWLHCAITLPGNRWYGDETFRLIDFKGQESISEPFDYQLELRASTSPSGAVEIDFDQVIGRPITVGINSAIKSDRPDAAARFMQAVKQGSAPGMNVFNGMVSSFTMAQPGVYRIGMKPALWKLTLTNNYRVYPQMSVRDAIEQLMRRHYLDYSLEDISGNNNLAVARVQDWLQSGESDYAFLQRLMSKAHIFYYFQHYGDRHVVVFSNRAVYPQAFGDRPLRYTYTSIDDLGLHFDDVVYEYSYQQSLVSSGVSGGFVHQESASEQDTVADYQTFSSQMPADPGELPFNQYRTYEYGFSNDSAQEYVKNTASVLASSSSQLNGGSTCMYFRVGYRFTLQGNMAEGTSPRAVRPTLQGKPFVLSRVQHSASAEGSYTNTFEATEANGLISPFSVQDTQQGSILARVVDVEGQRPQDWRFYEPQNFDPESSNLRDTQAAPTDLMAKGVYVQFSSPGSPGDPVWVKLAPHMQTVPEIGVMVLVSRANDESELPEVQSIVQANGSLVVTPSGWTANTNVGSSYSTSYGDNQSIRFGLHSDYDLDKAVSIVTSKYDTGDYRDTSYSQGASYSYATSENGKDGLLSRSDSFGCTYSTHEGAEVWSKSTLGKTTSYSTVTGDSYSEDVSLGTATRKSTQNIVDNTSLTAMQSSTSAVGLTTSIDTIGSTTTTSAVGISTGISMTGAALQTSVTGVRTESSLTGAVTSASLTGMSSSVSATGSTEAVAVTGSAIDTRVTGSSISTSVTGSSIQTNVVGSSIDTSVVGASTRLSVTGESTGISVTGDTTDIGVVASETHVGVKGMSTSVEVIGTGLSVKVAAAQIGVEITGISVSIPITYIYV
ncbi:contractile injection system protein, VgrG/Pvc8 family [Oleiagrimonas soli]|uniref:Type VI secretion system secreted protein VgrG n=1 Tax=Oleiagrimonas soli TaxID=1543381 RepID=A0A841KDH1_9GAMM|nr:contractile injection system protein, VgrG/Pvc8 family [Oleiagrimonas soli]MBB6183242.1 type VI secretion system secreted protein VgrG [Oleiagrimonas soli]